MQRRGFNPWQSSILPEGAWRLGGTPMAGRARTDSSPAPNVLLIPGTSSVTYLRKNVAAADLRVAE